MKAAKPVFRRIGVLGAVAVLWAGCGRQVAGNPDSVPPDTASVSYFTPEVVHVWPHDRQAFTQGLLFRNGALLESTGLYGQSSLREVELESGRILKEISVPAEYFAEGLTVIGDKAYQVTWKNQKGFIYDPDTFRLLGEFKYDGEGWGLTTDGHVLILSDGTNRVRFIDPTTFAVVRSISVTLNGKPVDQLNELEYVRGEIFANIWQTNRIVRIDAATGAVRGVIDCTGLLPNIDRAPNTDVLNGIAYDAAHDRLILTGKFWPKLFEVRLKPQTRSSETLTTKR